MGQCKYCGEDAGLFSHVHKECEEKHNQGIVILEDGIRRYFNPLFSLSPLLRCTADAKSNHDSKDGNGEYG